MANFSAVETKNKIIEELIPKRANIKDEIKKKYEETIQGMQESILEDFERVRREQTLPLKALIENDDISTKFRKITQQRESLQDLITSLKQRRINHV